MKYVGDQDYNGADLFEYVVVDEHGAVGTSPDDAGTVSIAVRAINDAPVNSVPGSQTTDEDTGLEFSAADGNLISISDVDAGDAMVEVRLYAQRGNLTLSGTAGLSFIWGDGNDDSRVIFRGTIENINAALDGLTFTPTDGYAGNRAKITMMTRDLGNTGLGWTMSDLDTIPITVSPAP